MSIFIYISQLENFLLRKTTFRESFKSHIIQRKIVYNIAVKAKRIRRMKHEIIGEERTSL